MKISAPLSDALLHYSNAARHRLHMPGHKGTLCAQDVTELPGLDSLHAPAGCIERAQELLAQKFGAAQSFFLVNGASSGILAFLLSLGEGKHILLERGAHTSFASGLALAGHTARFLPQRFLDGVPLPSVPADVEAMLKSERFDAVCVVSPNYYGVCARAELGEVCRAAGVPLFVDEAHGAHFIAGEPFPESAAGFSMAWVQSAHKTLPALTQGAYLHVCGDIDPLRVRRALALVQTTSPSYPIMRSLDEARAAFSESAWREAAALCDEFRAAAGLLPGIYCLGGDFGGFRRDPTRVVIDVSARCTGYAAAARLFGAGIAVEAADARRLILIVTPCDGVAWPGALLSELAKLPQLPHNAAPSEAATAHDESLPHKNTLCDQAASGEIRSACNASPYEIFPKTVCSIRAAVLGPQEAVPLDCAAGRVAAAAFGPYPPGAPLVWPGEQIHESVVQYLLGILRAGGGAFGLDGGRVWVVR